jgi:hypothetical protein
MVKLVSLDDDNFVSEFEDFKEECCAADVHNHPEIFGKIHRAYEIFDMSDRYTLDAVIGGLIGNMAYYRQMMDGTHDELSTHEEKDGN